MAEGLIRRTTFGHGSYGHECVLCGADDWWHEIVHEEDCPLVSVHAASWALLTYRDLQLKAEHPEAYQKAVEELTGPHRTTTIESEK